MFERFIYGSKGTYSLIKVIGEGGMSTVWLGRDNSSGKNVAVKIAKREPTAINKLSFEKNILKNMYHEHIIHYVDEGFYGNVPFLITEFAMGECLDRIYSGNIMDIDFSLANIEKLLLAIDYIHSLNIVHRDIKPKNIMIYLNDRDYLKLIDFGTAIYYNRAGIREAVISPGGYTPPEQYKFTCSPQGDIWSAGAVLFFMLTGQHPIIDMPGYPNIKFPHPPDPSKFNRDVDEEISKIVAKAMAWEPINRFSTAREMIEALERKRIVEEIQECPILEVMGLKIKIDRPIVRFGRLERAVASTISTKSNEVIFGPRKNIIVLKNDIIYVYLRDPYNWVSRKHFEIYERSGEWYIRDLGSLNRTAVDVGTGLKEIWVGHMRPGPSIKLRRKAIIHIAYENLSSPPYIVATFKNYQ